MTRVALVATEDVVRVTPQSEHAVPATFRTWCEAVAYCNEKDYTIHNIEEASAFCEAEMAALEEKPLIPADDVDDQGGEGSDV